METTPRILVVDDVDVNARVLARMLEKEGFQAEYALSGPEGRAKAVADRPDLILLDIMMPDENGLQTCTLLKADPRTHEIPVIFLSALDDVRSKVEGLTIGGVDYITKPFEKEEVLARIRLHLRIRAAYQALIAQQSERLQQLRQAQEAILVQPDDLPDAHFAVFYRPMHEAGGDFYDIVKIGEGIHGYFVADISGHDIGASFITAAVKALIRQNAGPLFTPEETLRVMNSVLGTIVSEGQFITAVYAYLNRRKAKLSIVSAGHPPLIHIPVHGQVQSMDLRGDILGAFETVSLGCRELEVARGDRFLLLSDGLLEYQQGRVSTQIQGVTGLLDACEAVRSRPLPDMVNGVVEHLIPDPADVRDDLLLLGVEV